ncbi:MAG: hypothetical protein PVJ49_08245, partial [Acidobacteriota bacterium]
MPSRRRAMPPLSFESILFPGGRASEVGETREAPAFFDDLNLDRIVAAVTSDKSEYDLRPVFHSGPLDLETILYRHEVMQDLEDAGTKAAIESFATG